MIVYHSSNHLFKIPDIEKIKSYRKNHENGELGLFFSTCDGFQRGFGKYHYKIIVPNEFNSMIMKIDEFKNKSFGNIEDWRNKLIEDGVDIILVEETNRNKDMGVFINLNIKMELMGDK